MPYFTVHAVVISHTRFALEIEADSEPEANLWASQLLAPHGMAFDPRIHAGGIADCDDYQIAIPCTEEHNYRGDPAVSTRGAPGRDEEEPVFAEQPW